MSLKFPDVFAELNNDIGVDEQAHIDDVLSNFYLQDYNDIYLDGKSNDITVKKICFFETKI